MNLDTGFKHERFCSWVQVTWVHAVSLPEVIRQHYRVLHAYAIIINIKKILVNTQWEGKEVEDKLACAIYFPDGGEHSQGNDFLGVGLNCHGEGLLVSC